MSLNFTVISNLQQVRWKKKKGFFTTDLVTSYGAENALSVVRVVALGPLEGTDGPQAGVSPGILGLELLHTQNLMKYLDLVGDVLRSNGATEPRNQESLK